MWGAIGNTWEQQKSKKSNMCPSHPPQKEKKTWSIGAIPHWVEVLFLWLYIYMFVFFLLLFFSSPTLARLMAGACLQGHSFNPIFLSSTRPLHTFLLYIWGVHLCWWLVFWSILDFILKYGNILFYLTKHHVPSGKCASNINHFG
jgi:hypothetical protein